MTLAASVMLATSAQAATPSTAEVNTTDLAVTDDTVTVGILHSITGTMAISEIGSVQAEKLAIEQINASGGVLGRQIEFVQEDGASDWPTFAFIRAVKWTLTVSVTLGLITWLLRLVRIGAGTGWAGPPGGRSMAWMIIRRS
jgi:opacity protein-like surface antigen